MSEYEDKIKEMLGKVIKGEAVFKVEPEDKISKNKEYGWSITEKSKEVMVEYTDPNPFKVLHIALGHLIQNIVSDCRSQLAGILPLKINGGCEFKIYCENTKSGKASGKCDGNDEDNLAGQA